MTLSPVDQLTLAEAQLEAALAEGPCSKASSTLADRCYDGWVVITERIGPTDVEQYEDSCSECRGTGRVPLLPGLRKPCSQAWGRPHYSLSPYTCSSCQGRGWVPETDGWKVLSYLNKSLVDIGNIQWAYREEPELGFWRAVVGWCRTHKEVQREPAD